MLADENITVARTFHEAWTERNSERGEAAIAEDCEFVDVARGEILRGPEGYRRDYERWLPPLHLGTHDLF